MGAITRRIGWKLFKKNLGSDIFSPTSSRESTSPELSGSELYCLKRIYTRGSLEWKKPNLAEDQSNWPKPRKCGGYMKCKYRTQNQTNPCPPTPIGQTLTLQAGEWKLLFFILSSVNLTKEKRPEARLWYEGLPNKWLTNTHRLASYSPILKHE